MGLKAVHFGGGNIGRGFVAEKLFQSGFEVARAPFFNVTACLLTSYRQVVFVDVVDKLIEQLQTTKSYTVTEIGGEGEKVNTISNYRAINSKTHEQDAVQEISSADLVSCHALCQPDGSTTDPSSRSPALSAPTSLNSLLP